MSAGYIILSDIHANLTALKAVYNDFKSRYDVNGVILLGDIINYGMRPNETIDYIEKLDIDLICNIWGNHEKALYDGDLTRFSTQRGRDILLTTKNMLTDNSTAYLRNSMVNTGYLTKKLDSRDILFVHGSLTDPFWGKMIPEEMSKDIYADYDYVISGHSHIPHLVENFYRMESPEYRNKKRTVFLNPGSVGQPRNHNPKAQYLYVDFENEIFDFNTVDYDIAFEKSLYNKNVDSFYANRLTLGI